MIFEKGKDPVQELLVELFRPLFNPQNHGCRVIHRVAIFLPIR